MDVSSYINAEYNQTITRVFWVKERENFWIYTSNTLNESEEFTCRSAIDTAKRLCNMMKAYSVDLEFVYKRNTPNIQIQTIQELNKATHLTNNLLLDYLILLCS